jgi:phage-related protein
MASKNTVTLTFAGDSAQLEKAFDRVGASAKGMSDDVGSASKGFDRLDDASGKVERAGRGLRDAFTGTQDAMKGTAALLRGDFSAETWLTVGAAVADLGGAFGDLIIPMARATASAVAHRTAMIAHAVASATVTAATKTWAAVQWVLNAALTANPIGIIIVGIGLLVAAIVWIATKTTWFQTAWKYAWGGIKSVAMGVWNWLKDLPGRIGSVFVKVAEFISRPFRAAFNMVANAWNNTVGRLRFTVPNWVPGIGGNTIAAPTLPTFKFHSGGRVPGVPGQEVMAVLQAGERVVPNGGGSSGSLGPDDLKFAHGAGFDRLALEWLDGLMRRNNLRLVRA